MTRADLLTGRLCWSQRIFQTWILAEEIKLSAAVDRPYIKLQDCTNASDFDPAVLECHISAERSGHKSQLNSGSGSALVGTEPFRPQLHPPEAPEGFSLRRNRRYARQLERGTHQRVDRCGFAIFKRFFVFCWSTGYLSCVCFPPAVRRSAAERHATEYRVPALPSITNNIVK
jgi:hypothetical protein